VVRLVEAVKAKALQTKRPLESADFKTLAKTVIEKHS